ncbi:MAG TPA: hypothetical protein VFD84_16980 [Candidatus Binatia bacterium]|nr:hypothetical protein [Candidatus Binatia bacterium]
MSQPETLLAPGTSPIVARGICYVLLAYEVAMSIDLDEAERRISAATERATIRHKRRAPRYFDYDPAPLRVMQDSRPIAVGDWRTTGSVELVIYDFGAISVGYAIPLSGSLANLVALADALYDNAALLADSRRRVEEFLADVQGALTRSQIANVVEPYSIFQIEEFATPCPPAALYTTYAHDVAQLLRSERDALSDQEVHDATAVRIAFGPDDVAIIDWDAALLFDREADDVRAVLEFANVELLEMRYLDQRLDSSLDQAYEALSRRTTRWSILPGSARADLRRIGQLQVDAAILFEGVNNALKLLGDQYLARVYRLVSERFHLAEWDASILRKLETLESIYQKMSDFAATWRLELLEWIIIALIAAEIALSVVVPLTGR